MLKADEEKELAYRIEDGDSEARDHLVRANLRLVVNIARSYQGKGLVCKILSPRATSVCSAPWKGTTRP